jgi:hypothetical protein
VVIFIIGSFAIPVTGPYDRNGPNSWRHLELELKNCVGCLPPLDIRDGTWNDGSAGDANMSAEANRASEHF